MGSNTLSTEQLALPADYCKEKNCPNPVVGSSITGKGKVCRDHNEAEWLRAARWPKKER